MVRSSANKASEGIVPESDRPASLPRLRSAAMPYVWPVVGVALATELISHARGFDKGQASLLYLPVVIVCAMRFGFGPAIMGAILSFLCWDWFFLPPYQTFIVENPKDFVSLIVFLIAAAITGRLAAQATEQTREARQRLQEMTTLFQASDAMSNDVGAEQALATLAEQIQTICNASGLMIFRNSIDGGGLEIVSESGPEVKGAPSRETALSIATTAFEHDQTIGLGDAPRLWAKALARITPNTSEVGVDTELDPRSIGVYIPLRAADQRVGVLHVGTRRDGHAFTALQENLILTLANHAAAVIARENLSAQAAQAAALKEADALKDALLSLVSHELRTPLSAIKASASGLLQENALWDDASRREALVSIDSETDRLTGIVSNLLDLSRLQAGAWEPVRDWCDIGEVVDTALQRLPVDEASRVRVSIPGDVPLIRIDYAQVALVVENLLRNAIKYTPAATPIDIAVKATYGALDRPTGIIMTVRDYGEGIEPDEALDLFARFYRSERHRNGTIHGTGIGLALCKAVVDAHGGTIAAVNALAGQPRGAVFTMELPVN